MTTQTSRRASSLSEPRATPPAGTDNSPQAISAPAPIETVPGGVSRSEIDADLSARLAAAWDSPQASVDPSPNDGPPAGSKTSRGRSTSGAHSPAAPADDFPGGHSADDAQVGTAAGEQSPVPAIVPSAPEDEPLARDQAGRSQVRSETPSTPAATGEGRPAAMEASASTNAPLLADPFLALAADVLDDLEKVRIGNENRLRQLTRDEPDKDGIERGFGLTLAHPSVARLAAMVRTMKCDSGVVTDLTGEKAPKKNGCCLEHDAERNLVAALRRNPLHQWLESIIGIGEKQGARLLGSVGDPYMRPELVRRDKDGEVISVEPARPRLVSELWAYCGLHVTKVPVSGHAIREDHQRPAADGPVSVRGHQDHAIHASVAEGGKGGDPGQAEPEGQTLHAGIAPRRTRGQRANWSGTAKMRAYLVAESCIKQRTSPYRLVYDRGREHYAGAVHEAECARCGPKGKPAQPGSPLSDGHKHARAMRLVMKEILRDLWARARQIHQEARPDPAEITATKGNR